MEADHLEICRFKREDSSWYKQVIYYIELLVQTAIRESRKEAEVNTFSDLGLVLTTRDFGEQLVLPVVHFNALAISHTAWKLTDVKSRCLLEDWPINSYLGTGICAGWDQR